MPPSLHPPHLHLQKLKRRRHHPAAMAKRGLAAILYKFRDVHVHRPPPSEAPSPAPSTPSARYAQRCYPPAPSAWAWPSSCRHPRTSSFRGPPPPLKDAAAAAAVFRTVVNSVYDTASEQSFLLRRSSVEDDAASCADDDDDRSPPSSSSLGDAAVAVADAEQVDEEEKETAVVRGLRSERLFFEPAGAEFLPAKQGVPPARGKNEAAAAATVAVAGVIKSEEPATTEDDAPRDKDDGEPAAATEGASAAAAKGSSAVVVTVESKDPYSDFRASMAEMVAAHGLRDWEALEELLAWYLKLNAKGVHAAIVGAFIDLLVSMAPSPPSPSPSSSCITFEECSSATFDEEDGKS